MREFQKFDQTLFVNLPSVSPVSRIILHLEITLRNEEHRSVLYFLLFVIL